MNPPSLSSSVLCVALNPAIDQTIEVSSLRVGEVNRALRASQNAGGKAVNVASCLADYGVSVGVTGLLGRENPERFNALFDAKGIARHCLLVDGATRINTKLVDPALGQTTDINLPGPQQSPEQIAASLAQLEDVLSQHAGSVEWVVLSGSLPPGWPADTYAGLVRHAHALGARVLLDSSGAAFAQALAAGPEIIKPNRTELAEHLGRPLERAADVAAAARALIESHPGLRLVVVSMGEEGAFFVEADAMLLAHPLPVTPLSSVGAGDAMVAGIVAGQLAGLGLAEGAQLATAFAAAKLTRLGPHLPEIEQVRALAAQVRLGSPG